MSLLCLEKNLMAKRILLNVKKQKGAKQEHDPAPSSKTKHLRGTKNFMVGTCSMRKI